jgi:hypothetical protein
MALANAPLKVLGQLLGITLAVALISAVLLFVVPDGNDYAKATLDKHGRLERVPSPKIVFVGGSNLSYGLDSETIERALDYQVVNMGMNAYLGLRFLIDEVSPSLKSGDVLLLSLENEMFRVQNEFDAVDGRTSDIFMMVKTRPQSLAFVPWKERLAIVADLPQVLQLKAFRILRNIFGSREPNRMDLIESRSGFNAYGDLVSHIGEEWDPGVLDGLDLEAHPLDARVPVLLRQVASNLANRNVKLLMLPAPMPDTYFQKHQKAVLETRSELERDVPGLLAGDPRDYVYPESCFFDDIHHLNGECRMRRSRQVVQDLTRRLKPTQTAAATNP